MTNNERQQKRLKRLRANRQCVKCAKDLDRAGVICSDCLTNTNEESRKTYHWYQDNGICPNCRKNKILGTEKNCPECRARKTNNANARLNRDNGELLERKKQCDKNRYKARKERGECVVCGKKNQDTTYVTCPACRIKRNRKRNDRRKKTIGIELRRCKPLYGICYFCDNPIMPGRTICETHYNFYKKHSETNENFKKGRAEHLEKIKWHIKPRAKEENKGYFYERIKKPQELKKMGE